MENDILSEAIPETDETLTSPEAACDDADSDDELSGIPAIEVPESRDLNVEAGRVTRVLVPRRRRLLHSSQTCRPTSSSLPRPNQPRIKGNLTVYEQAVSPVPESCAQIPEIAEGALTKLEQKRYTPTNGYGKWRSVLYCTILLVMQAALKHGSQNFTE